MSLCQTAVLTLAQYAALWVESAVLPSGTTGNNNFSGKDKVLHFLILHKQTADNVVFPPPKQLLILHLTCYS